MLRVISILMLVVTLTGCGWSTCGTAKSRWKQGSEDCFSCCKIDTYDEKADAVNAQEVSRIVLIFGEKVKYDKLMHLEDSVVFYEDKINRIRLDFSSLENTDLWEAREDLVDIVEDFLELINQNSVIAGSLRSSPFTADDLEVHIRYKSFYDEYLALTNIGAASLRKGVTHYYAWEAFDCNVDCWHRRSEFYWQSKNFVDFRREGEILYGPNKADGAPSALEDIRYFPFDRTLN